MKALTSNELKNVAGGGFWDDWIKSIFDLPPEEWSCCPRRGPSWLVCPAVVCPKPEDYI